MKIIEAIEAMQAGRRLTWMGSEVRLAGGRLQINDGGWHDMVITPEAMESYEEAPRVKEWPIVDNCGKLYVNIKGEYIHPSSVEALATFRGYLFKDGHLGAHLWCVKNREIHCAIGVLIKEIT